MYGYDICILLQTSSWVAFLFLFVVGIVTIFRTFLWFRRRRQERRFKATASLVNNEVLPAGLVNSEELPSTDEPDDKTPAAI